LEDLDVLKKLAPDPTVSSIQVILNLKLSIISYLKFLKGYICPSAHHEGMYRSGVIAALILNHGTRLK
jgi:hypothetical protein